MSTLYSQQKNSTYFKNGIENPSLLATHHFGIFSARIQQNLKRIRTPKATLRFTAESGNTFHPYVAAYLPKNQRIRDEFSSKIWYNRQFHFENQSSTPAEIMDGIFDAVIKGYHLVLTFPIAKKHELTVSLRSYLITKGTTPFSIFTGDQFIEWFHSNIAGGEDPYGRKYYGMNQVHFKYTDRNGNVLQLHNGDFFLGGIQLNHHYYPTINWTKKHNIFVNIGSHLGINTSQFNPSLDVGVSANMIKKTTLNNLNEFNFGIGGALLRKNMIQFKEPIDLGNNPFLASLEAAIEFTKFTNRKNYHSFELHYQWQTRYNQKEEASYLHLKGDWDKINAGWHHGFTTLYTPLSAWAFVHTYGTSKYKLSLYLKEDFLVNNAPDVQTGISIKIPIAK